MTDDKESKDILHLQKKDEEPRLSVEHVGHVIVFVVGNSNVYPKQAQGLSQEMKAKMLGLNKPKVLVDMSNVQLITSAFIGGLIELHKHVTENSGVMKLLVTSDKVDYTLRLVRLHKLMEISADRDSLLAQF